MVTFTCFFFYFSVFVVVVFQFSLRFFHISLNMLCPNIWTFLRVFVRINILDRSDALIDLISHGWCRWSVRQSPAPWTNSISVFCFSQQQQLQAQHLSHGHGLPVPLTPHPSGLQPPAIPPIGSSAGLLALSSALGGQSHLPIKDEKKHHDNDHQRGRCCQMSVWLRFPSFFLNSPV